MHINLHLVRRQKYSFSDRKKERVGKIERKKEREREREGKYEKNQLFTVPLGTNIFIKKPLKLKYTLVSTLYIHLALYRKYFN